MILSDLLKNYTVGLLTLCLDKKIFIEHSFNENFDIIGDFDLILKLSKKKNWLHSRCLQRIDCTKKIFQKKKNIHTCK